jgi:hypothetical protein
MFDNTPVVPARVNLDLGQASVEYLGLVSSKITFGGDIDNGNGPSLSSDFPSSTVLTLSGGSLSVSNLNLTGPGASYFGSSIAITNTASINPSNITDLSLVYYDRNHGGLTNATAGQINTAIGTLTVPAASAGSNFFNFSVSAGESVPTNVLSSSIVDFAKSEQTFQTNNVPNILGFTGKDTTGKMTAYTLLKITNSAGLGSAFQTNCIFPANTHVMGNSVMTNWKEFWVEFNQPTGPTNVWDLGGW